MTEKKKQSDDQIWIRSIRRDPPDVRKIGRAFIAAVMREAEAEAAAQAEHAKSEQADGDAGGGPQEEES
jgi:hypothetical protein